MQQGVSEWKLLSIAGIGAGSPVGRRGGQTSAFVILLRMASLFLDDERLIYFCPDGVIASQEKS